MASEQDPLVLVVADVGLRSLLVARLGMDGEAIVTADRPGDVRLPADGRARAILIIDEALLPDGIVSGAALAQRLDYGRVIVLGAPGERAAIDDMAVTIPSDRANREVPAQVRSWREERLSKS